MKKVQTFYIDISNDWSLSSSFNHPFTMSVTMTLFNKQETLDICVAQKDTAAFRQQ